MPYDLPDSDLCKRHSSRSSQEVYTPYSSFCATRLHTKHLYSAARQSASNAGLHNVSRLPSLRRASEQALWRECEYLKSLGATDYPAWLLSRLLHMSPPIDQPADMIQLHPDDAYLSYYDVRLTKEDVDCIKDDWLTDNVRPPSSRLFMTV